MSTSGSDFPRWKFAAAITKARVAKGLTARDLGKLAGISGQSVINIEDSMHAPSLASSLRIAEALDISIDEVFSLGEFSGRSKAKKLQAGKTKNDKSVQCSGDCQSKLMDMIISNGVVAVIKKSSGGVEIIEGEGDLPCGTINR